MLRAGLEQQWIVVQHGHRLADAVTVVAGHGVVVVAADAVDARNVTQQLTRGDRPLLLRVRRHIALDWRIEIEAPPVVQKGGSHRRHRLREGAETETRERRDRRATLDVGPAEPFGPDDFAIHRDGH